MATTEAGVRPGTNARGGAGASGTALAPRGPTQLTFGFRPDVLELTKLINPDLTPKEMATFLYEAWRLGLDPASGKQIYAVIYNKKDPEKRKLSVQIAVDGLRAIAAKSGLYDGSAEVEDGPDVTTDGVTHPEWCRATVWRRGSKHPFVAKVRWSERVKKEKYGPDAGKLTDFWRDQPYSQLEKCAEAAVIRKAFPLQVRGTELEGEAPDGHPEAVDADFRSVDESSSVPTGGADLDVDGKPRAKPPSASPGHTEEDSSRPETDPTLAQEDPAVTALHTEISQVIREDSGSPWSKAQFSCYREGFSRYSATHTGITRLQEITDVPFLETMLSDLKQYRHDSR